MKLKAEGGRRKAKVLWALALAFMSLVAAAQSFAQSFVVPAELWDRPRSSGALLGQPPVRQAVDRYLEEPASRLIVHHGASRESQLAAEELRAWLLALSIEPGRIALRSGLAPAEPLRIELVREGIK